MISLRYTLILLFSSFTSWAQTSSSVTPPSSPTPPVVSSPTVTSPTVTPPTTPTPPSVDPALSVVQSIQVTPPVAPSVAPVTPTPSGVPVTPSVTPSSPPTTVNGKPDTSPPKLNEKDTACKKRWILPTEEASVQKKTDKQLEIEKKRVELLKEKIRKNPTQLKLVVRLAKEFYDQGDYEKTGLLLWKQIDRLDLNDMALLAKSHQKAGQLIDMRKVAELMIGKNDKFAESYLLLAQTYDLKNSKEKELAKNNFIKAIELESNNVEAILKLVEIYYSESNLYEARTLLSDMLKKNPENPQLTSALCEVLSLDSLHDDTRRVCPQAIRLAPEVVDNYVYNGISYKETETWPEAHKWFQTAVDKFPTSEFALICLAEAQQQKKDTVGAYKSLKAAHQAQPSSNRALLAYAKASFDLKKLDEALEGYAILCARNKNYAVELRRAIQDLRKSSFKNDETARFEAALRTCGFF